MRELKHRCKFGCLAVALITALAGLVSAADFPLQVSPSNRYLVDHSGVPFLVQGDSPWSLVIALNNAEVGQYLDDRRAKGFNTIIVNLIEHQFNGADNPNPAPINRFGQAPFLTPGDFSTPNEAYFANADWVIDQAAARGMVVVLFPCYAGYPGTQEGWSNEMLANGAAKCQQYGQYVGNRYKNKPNIIWAMYGDHDPDASIQPLVEALAAGIHSADSNHLFTAHLQRDTQVRSALAGSATWLQLNSAYSTSLVYPGCLAAYATQPVMPFFQIENDYEGGSPAPAAATVRAEAYWANLSGAGGQMYGNSTVWLFASGWQTELNSVGANDMTRLNALFLSRSWTNLVPDSAHTVLTGGYGTFGQTNYVAAARTTDGATMIAYLPAGGTVTVDLGRISGSQAQAWWYDPRTGSAAAIGTFATSGSHDFLAPTVADWVLVIDDTAQLLAPPGSQSIVPALTVTTSALPVATVGLSYSAQLSASGGVGSYVWSLVSGILPANLTLLPSGLLSGTPAASGNYNLTVGVADSLPETVSRPLTLTVNVVTNTAPTITSLAGQTTTAGTPVGPLSFTVGDQETAVGSLTLSGGSSNVALVPNANIAFGGSGASRTVTVTPVAGQTGTATITVTVSDGALTAATSFALTVNPILTSGLVAAYSFNAGTGTTTADASGTGNTGTLVGATWTTQGKYGSALSFNGSSRVSVPDSNSLDLTTNMTVEAWVYPTVTPSGWSNVVMKEQTGEFVYALYAGAPVNRPNAYIYTNAEQGFAGSAALPLNTWSHLAMTYDGATLKLYVNGSLNGSQAITGSMFKSTGNLSIGGNAVWGEYFRGTIDEVRIYNRPLSVSEIQSDMATPVGGAANTAPTITGLANQTTTTGAAVGPLSFTVGDLETAVGSLTVSGTSSNVALVPNANISFGGSGASRTVTVTPAAGQVGTATITVTVSDGSLTATSSFTLTVNPLAPVITSATTAGGTVGTAFTYTITATNSPTGYNATGLPAGLSVNTATGAITGTPTTAATSNITLSASNAGGTGSATLVLTVNAAANTAPTITSLANQTTITGAAVGPLSFTVGDLETAAGSLTVSGGSSNLGLVPNANIGFGGSGASRTVTVTPASGQTGTATITVTVSDGSLTVSSAFLLTVNAQTTVTGTYSNAASIVIPSQGAASPYPSAISVAGTNGTITNVTVALKGVTHTNPDDLDVLLVGPGGQMVMLMSDCGGSGDLNNLTFTFSDAASALLSDNGQLSSGTFKPTNFSPADTFPAPAPSGTFGSLLSVFNGLSANGTWALYVFDDRSGGQGSFAGGWSLTVTTMSAGQAPTIGSISNQSVSVNTPTAAIPFTIADADTPLASLTVSGSSSNVALVPNANIGFGGSGASRTVTVTPASGQVGTATITVTVSDGSLTAATSFALTVNPLAPVIMSATTAGGTVGTAFTYTITATNSPTGYNATGLPAGLSVNTATGAITGTPTTAATSNITLSASNAGGTGSATLVLTVNAAANTAPTITSLANQTTSSGTAVGPLSFTVGDLETAAGSLTVSGGSSNVGLVPNANIGFGGSGASRTVTVTPAAAQTGTATITVTVSDGSLTAATSFALTVNPLAPVITSATTASGTVGTAFTYTITATNSPTGYNATGLPTGLSVNTATGAITGTPTTAATSNVTLSASNAGGTGSTTLVLTVNAAANTAPTITSLTNQTTTTGTAVGPLSFTVGDLETAAGSLTLSGSSSNVVLVPNANITFGGSGASRTVTVTPAAGQTGTATITVTVSDGSLTAASSFILTVNPLAPVITSVTTAGGTVGTAFTYTITATNSPTGYNATGLPAGLSINTVTGAITGTPTAAATSNITLSASNAGGTGSATLVLTVNAPANTAPTITSLANQTTTTGTAVGPLNFTVGDQETAAGSLTVSGVSSNVALVPNANISFGGSGASRTVTVTPAAGQVGTATITVTVSDGSLTAASSFVLTVNPAPVIGLVAAYSFNAGSGTTTVDASGTGNTGSLVGATWTTQGKYGSALSFNGSSRVNVPDSNSLDLTTNMTMEAWVYPTVTPSGWSTVALKEQTGEFVYALYAGAPVNRPNAYIYTTDEQGFAGTAALPLNTWSHLAMTYDGTTLRLYVNGVLNTSQAVSGSIFKSTGNLSIGGNTVWGEFFRGSIDEVRIYSRPLSAAEIQNDMATPISG